MIVTWIMLGLAGVLALATLHTVRGIRKQVFLMARSEADLQADLDAIKADLASIQTAVTTEVGTFNTTIQSQQAQITALKAQLAAGTPVTQDQLDALAGEADTLKASADALLQSVTPAPPTPGTTGS